MFTYSVLIQAFKHFLSPFEDGNPELNTTKKEETLSHQPHIHFPNEFKCRNLFAKREKSLCASRKTITKHKSCHKTNLAVKMLIIRKNKYVI
jgi:hypothetical protein